MNKLLPIFIFAVMAVALQAASSDTTAPKVAPAPVSAAVKTDSAATVSPVPPAVPDSQAIPAKSATDSSAQVQPAEKVDTVQANPAERKSRKTIVRDKRAAKEEETDVIRTYKGNVNQLKSPKKAFFLSFILPGLGEYYAGAGLIRVGVPVAVELASYTTAIIFTKNYNDLTRKYQNYANDHYNHDKFYSWYSWVTDSSNHTVSLPDSMSHITAYLEGFASKSNDYYEMIGKYDMFTQGWDDPNPDMIGADYSYNYMRRDIPNSAGAPLTDEEAQHYRAYAINSVAKEGSVVTDTDWVFYHDPGTNNRPFYFGKSENQLHYMTLRDDANYMGDRIKWAFYTMILNRIVCSIDAVFAANAYNRRMTGGNLSFLDKVRLQPAKIGKSDLSTNGMMVRYTF